MPTYQTASYQVTTAGLASVEAAYRPHLVGGDVVFTDLDLVASSRP